MKKLVYESLEDFTSNNKNSFRIREISIRDGKYYLKNLGESLVEDSISYFPTPEKLIASLYNLNEMEEGPDAGGFIDPFTGKPFENLSDFFDAVARKIIGKKTERLGGGAHGFAYDLAPKPQILKFSNDTLEADNSIKLLGKDPVNMAKIYRVFVVEYFNPKNTDNRVILYGIQQEKAEKVGKTGLNSAAGIKPELSDRSLEKRIKKIGREGSEGEANEIKKELNGGIKDKEILIRRNFIVDLLLEMGKYDIMKGADYTVPENSGFRKLENGKYHIIVFDLGGDIAQKPETEAIKNQKHLKITNKII